VRAVTADHVLFDECVAAFRCSETAAVSGDVASTHSYLLLGFDLPESWGLPNCTMHPTVRVPLPGPYAAFISRIDNPKWAGRFNTHLFGIALASIVSFATGRVCGSPRDDYLCRRDQLDDHGLAQLALHHPILIAGPGCVHPSLSRDRINSYHRAISDLIEKLFSIERDAYLAAMQAIRLVHLSLLNKRSDFGLAYLLIVSAIEAIAQKAIKRDKVRFRDPPEDRWRDRAKTDPEFGEVLSRYLEARGKEQYLKERYIAFIERFAPVACWEEIVAHPLQDVADYISELSPAHDMEHVVGKHWFEKYPSDLPAELIRQILEDSYTHRSCYIHRGEQPPTENRLRSIASSKNIVNMTDFA
jgi:hypothetical protein